jgi:DNA-binding transcriptional ArsR family regulator
MCFAGYMDDAALRAIANPRRREILRLVWEQERSSGDIASHFNVSWPAISQNLRVLEEVGFVRKRRCRQTRLYRADRARLGPLKTVLFKMWENDLDRLVVLAEAEASRKKPKQ